MFYTWDHQLSILLREQEVIAKDVFELCRDYLYGEKVGETKLRPDYMRHEKQTKQDTRFSTLLRPRQNELLGVAAEGGLPLLV